MPLPVHNVQVVVYVGTTGPRVGLDWRAGGGAGDSNYAVIQDSLTDCFVLSANFFFGTLACAPVAIPLLQAPVDLSAVWFAVKTCEKYHHTRRE